MTLISKHLNKRQTLTIERIGDVLIPANPEFPAFSASGCSTRIDRILNYMPESDLRDLKMLLTLLSFLPRFLLAAVLRFLEFSDRIPGPLSAPLRLIRLGLRGLVMTLYYGDKKNLEALGYHVGVYLGDRPQGSSTNSNPSR